MEKIPSKSMGARLWHVRSVVIGNIAQPSAVQNKDKNAAVDGKS